MQMIIRYMIAYTSILLGSIYISNKFNKKIESCIIVDILLKMVLLYLFGLMHQLFIGVVIAHVLPILLGILSLIQNRKKQNLKENILTNGLLFFTILYFLFIIFTFNSITNIWDEYSYWSLVSKKMYYSNELINSGMTIIYPPFPTLWQYFFTKTLNQYSQGAELFANDILAFALLLPLFEKTRKNNKISNIAVGIIILCVPTILNYIILYQAIYADAILGLLIGYLFYQKYHEKDHKFLLLSLILSLIVLALTKETGFYIAGILIGISILNDILNLDLIKGKNKIQKIKQAIKARKNTIYCYIIVIVVVLLSYSLWKIMIKDYTFNTDPLEREYSKYIDQPIGIQDGLKTIITTIFGSNNESFERDNSNRLFFNALSSHITFSQPITISLFGFFLIYLIFHAIFSQFYIQPEEKEKHRNAIISITIGLIIYSLLIQFAYIVKFSVSEASTHASLDRYINTYYLGIFVFSLYMVLEKMKESHARVNFKYTILILTILLMTPLNIITDATIVSGSYKSNIQYLSTEVKNMAISIKEKITQQDRLCIVNQTADRDALSLQLKYYLVPEVNARSVRKFEKNMENLYQGENIVTKWEENLYQEYDYIYLIHTDEYFEDFASSLFKNQEIEENTIYKIEKKENHHILLVKVES